MDWLRFYKRVTQQPYALPTCTDIVCFQTLLHRTHKSQTAVQTFSVTEQLYISENVCLYLFYCIILLAINQFLLQAGKKAFHAWIIVWTSGSAHWRFAVNILSDRIADWSSFSLRFILTMQSILHIIKARMLRRWIYALSFNNNDGGIRTSKTVNGTEHVYHLSGRQIEAEEWGNNLLVYLYDA